MYQYPPGPPHPGWSYEYTPSPTAPHFSSYYGSHYATPHTPPPRSKRHGYRASYSAAKDGAWYPASPQGYPPWQNYHDGVPDYASPPRKHEHVSATFGGHGQRKREPGWRKRHAAPAYEPFVDVNDDMDYLDYNDPFAAPPPRRPQRRPAAATYAADEAYHSLDSSDDDRRPSEQHYRYCAPPLRPTARHEPASRRKARPPTDQYFFYSQAPHPEETGLPKRSRARRASTSARPPPRPTKPSMKTPPKATEEDAIRAGIPAGYSIKNWDPEEAPIILLGSAFDANSLGKWIYDWTVYRYGATAPMANVAGELWLLLIKLAGKVKRADEYASLVRSHDSRELLEGFLESGERLWDRFKTLLKACEHFMWKAAKREGNGAGVSMGRSAGCEFVDSIFGRERELENTEKFMNSIRLWNMRFDANCDDILESHRF